MAFRAILALLIGLAAMVAPLGMPAMASAPDAGRHQAGAAMDHCGEASPDKPAKAADKDCCATMCLGIFLPSALLGPAPDTKAALRPAAQSFRRAIPNELPTPPPKTA